MSLFSSEQEEPHEEFHSFRLFEIIALSDVPIKRELRQQK